MRTRKEKILSALLSVAMLLSLLPTVSVPARAELQEDKLDIDTEYAGKYMDAAIGSGASAAYIVNGAFASRTPADFGIGKEVTDANNAKRDADDYNMMKCFGMIRKGSVVSAAASGFTRSGGQSINMGTGWKHSNDMSLNMATYNDKGGKSGNLTVTIANNPTLRELAKSGELQMYFEGYACGVVESRKAWPDDHTYISGSLNVSNATADTGAKTNDSFSKVGGKSGKKFGTGGWVTLDTNSVITISWNVSKSAGKFSNGWGDNDVGLGNCVLLFRKCSEPELKTYTMTANGDLSYNANSNRPEVLLGNNGKITLDLAFVSKNDDSKPESVTSALMATGIRGSDDYLLLEQLGKRTLFRNTTGTGYVREGEPVYLKLTEANGRSVTDTDEARVSALRGSVSSLRYEWNATYGDYYGNRAVPSEGDWAGLNSGNNSMCFLDSIVLASFHDLAGNPLRINGKIVTYEGSNGNYTTDLAYEKATEATKFDPGNAYHKVSLEVSEEVYEEVYEPVNDAESWSAIPDAERYQRRVVLPGTVSLNNAVKEDVSNPFGVINAENTGFDFIIDAVSPTYSKTANAVQPEILTNLTLSAGDSFDIALNFSEFVKLRQFQSNGSSQTVDGTNSVATGYSAENLYLKLSNGMTAKYKSGMGTKQLVFTVTVPAGDTYNTTYRLLSVKPSDWETGYTDYFTRDGSKYVQVTGESAPDWAANTYYTRYLDIVSMYLEKRDLLNPSADPVQVKLKGVSAQDVNKPTATSYILTDYVGNPLCEYLGTENDATTEAYTTPMNWARLQVDNDAPTITIKNLAEKTYQISATDASSGIFHIANNTGTDNNSGMIYYVWVNGEEVAGKVKNAFTADNYEKVKRFSLTADENANVTVDGKTYTLKAAANGKTVTAPEEDGQWFLLAFTSDMTWDSARQMVQYSKSNYTTNPSGYLSELAKLLGVNLSDMFQKVENPTDWETNYHTYYYLDGSTYSLIPLGREHPVWAEGKYYDLNYDRLTGDAAPTDWNPYREYNAGTDSGKTRYAQRPDGGYAEDANGDYVYDTSAIYYSKSGEGETPVFTPVARSIDVPDWKAEKYYTRKTVTRGDKEPTAIYVRGTDEQGNPAYVTAYEAFAPDFGAQDVYKEENSSKVKLEERPTDWATTYTNYFTQDEPEYYTYDAADHKWGDYTAQPVFKDVGPYYAAGSTTAATSAAWNTTYYSDAGHTQEVTNAVIPEFVENQFYGYVALTSTDFSTDTGDDQGNTTVKLYDDDGTAVQEGGQDAFFLWEEVGSTYYVKDGNGYTQVQKDEETGAAADYDSGTTYYRFTKLAEQPTDWSTNYAAYVTEKPHTYTQFTVVYPESEPTYYGTEFEALKAEPNDWKESFGYYFTDENGANPVKLVVRPEYTKNTYYQYHEIPLTKEPDDWDTNYDRYYYKSGGTLYSVSIDTEYEKTRLKNAGLTTATEPPTRANYGTVYKLAVDSAEGSSKTVGQMAETIKDPTRKEAFLSDMIAASGDTAAQIRVLRRYYEFAEPVHAADVFMMSNAAEYSGWARDTYVKNDSNWVSANSGGIDLTPPKTQISEPEGNNRGSVKLQVTVADTDSALNEVWYQFVEKGAAVSDNAGDKNYVVSSGAQTENPTKWTVTSGLSGDKKTITFTVSTKDNGVTATGDYDLCVYAKDTQGNEQAIARRTVTVNGTVAIQYKLNGPAGTSPYRALKDMSVEFYGTANGVGIFEEQRDFKVYAVIDQNGTKDKDATDWGDAITAKPAAQTDGMTTFSYALPELADESGYWYLHIRYTYRDDDGVEKKSVIDRAYALNGATGEILISQTGRSDDGITVAISALNATTIQYQITTKETTKDAVKDSGGWQTYTNALNLEKSKYPEETYHGVVRVWAKAGSLIRFQDFNLSGSSLYTGVIASPDLTLLGFTDDGKSAVIRLDKLGDALSVGAEYSVSVARSGADVESLTWQRWMPLDNIVKVKLGDRSGNLDVRFKFRNGSAVTDKNAYRLLTITPSDLGNGEDWMLATRSTLREVGSGTGVTLNYVTKSGTSQTPNTYVTNGVYQNGVLQSVVSNVNDNPPGYSLQWSDMGEHSIAKSVSVTVKSEENITVTNLTFQPSNGAAKTLAPTSTYLFKENGTARFTIQNEAGNSEQVPVQVNWLDSAGLQLDVERDYTGYKTISKTVDAENLTFANGVRLKVKPQNGKFFTELRVDDNDILDTLYYKVTENGSYHITACDAAGNVATKIVTVNNLITAANTPKKVGDGVVGTTTVNGKSVPRVTVTFQGKYDAANQIYDGMTSVGKTAIGKDDGTDTYTITKNYTRNGTYTEYVTDSLGNTTPYRVTVDELDETAPVIQLPAGVISMDKTTSDMDKGAFMNWLRSSDGGNVSVTDNKEGVTVELTGSTVETSRIGAYNVLINATDAAGNTSVAHTTVYIMPKDSMLIKDSNGVLFCSQSKDAALVDRTGAQGHKQIVLTIKNHDLVSLTKAGGTVEKIENALAKITVTVRRGAYREGQMKYFDPVAITKINYDRTNRTATVTLNVDDLPGTGWYTVLIRNSEREREYTTFFINAEN